MFILSREVKVDFKTSEQLQSWETLDKNSPDLSVSDWAENKKRATLTYRLHCRDDKQTELSK